MPTYRRSVALAALGLVTVVSATLADAPVADATTSLSEKNFALPTGATHQTFLRTNGPANNKSLWERVVRACGHSTDFYQLTTLSRTYCFNPDLGDDPGNCVTENRVWI